jgi:hypothetical protein
MEKQKPQDFAHHGRFFPPFHFFVLPVFLVNFVTSLILLKKGITYASILHVFVAAAFVMVALCARLMAIAVQDRLICLEERLRLAQMLSGDAKGRIVEFTPEQLIGLRFASDEELSDLAQKVLADRIADRKTIKSLIKKWRPDYMRA